MPSPVETKKICTLALLLVMALAARQAELLLPLPLPGVKPGLANLFGLVALLRWGPKESLSLTACRILLGGFLSGFGLPFYCSCVGAAVSQILVIGLYVSGILHPVFLSLWGAFAHNCAQLVLVGFLVGWAPLAVYGPVILVVGLVAGFCVGLIAQGLLQRLGSII